MKQTWTLSSLLEHHWFTYLDDLAQPVQQAIHQLFRKNARGQHVKNWLNGVPLRHRMHPAIVLLPLGTWTSAGFLDLLDSLSPSSSHGYGKSADACIALGIIGALPSAATGLSDWVDTYDHPQRVGMAHALVNGAAFVCYSVSLGMRLAGWRQQARHVAWFGLGSVTLAGALGGDLVYNLGISVTHLLHPRPPDGFADVLASAELEEDQPVIVEVEHVPVLLLRRNNTILAVESWCPHAGGDLIKGGFEDDVVECPLHGARFSLVDGCPLTGPATAPLRTFAVEERNGRIVIRPSYEGQSWPPAPQPPEGKSIRVQR